MNRKAKGTRAERELVHLFHKSHWSCLRTAGSGSTRYPAPDVIAGNGIRRIAIECKVTKEKKKYFTKEEVEQLQIFCRNFGAEGWIGMKFTSEPWWFVMLEDLEDTGKCLAVSIDLARRRGVSFEQLIYTPS